MAARIAMVITHWLIAVAAGLTLGFVLPPLASSAAIFFGIFAAILFGLGDPTGQLGGLLLGWAFGVLLTYSAGSALAAQILARRLRVPSVVPWFCMYAPVTLAGEALWPKW